LSSYKDMASREIVGWSMAAHLGADLACEALLMAIRRRQPSPAAVAGSRRRG
jgi:transposase InsO family protein